MLEAGDDLAEEPGESGHGDDTAESESYEIGERIRRGGKTQCREDTEEM